MTMDVARRSWRSTTQTLLLPAALGVGSAIVALGLTMKPPGSGPVAVLFPPWWNAARSMQAAAAMGSIVRFGAFPFVVVVDPDATRPERRALPAGAWWILDPRVAGGCEGPSS